jgi:hypothetical protein
MIRKLEEGSLLLADDLYNSYYHFSLIRSHGCHVIVPGKRKRRYAVKREICAPAGNFNKLQILMGH